MSRDELGISCDEDQDHKETMSTGGRRWEKSAIPEEGKTLERNRDHWCQLLDREIITRAVCKLCSRPRIMRREVFPAAVLRDRPSIQATRIHHPYAFLEARQNPVA